MRRRLCLPSTASIKTTWYTVRASPEQARRWARAARCSPCGTVSAWLAALADEQARRLEAAGVEPPPFIPRGKRKPKRGPYRRRRGGSL
jgi:hypothetical protein